MSGDSLEQLDPQGMEEVHTELADANAELERLRAEVSDLQRQVSEPRPAEPQRHTGRRFLVGLLIVLGCIVAAVGNGTLWLRNVVLDTNSWVSTVAPLTQNEVIVNALSVYVVGEVFEEVDVKGLAEEVLPPDFAFLSVPLTGALQDAVRGLVADVIQSDQFNAVWVAVNRTGHELIIGALTRGGDLLYLTDGQLTLDLTDLFGAIQSTIGLERLDLFGDDQWGRFVLFESHQVAAIQQVLNTLNAIGLLLPIVALALFFLAWLASLWRRQTLLWIGVGVAITMVLFLLVLALVKPALLASMVNPLIRTVTGELWNVITRGLVYQTIFVLIVGVLVALGAALAGPHPRAVAIRAGVRKQWGKLRGQPAE